MAGCGECNIVGLMAMTYPGIVSASINGSSNLVYVLQSCIEGVVDNVLKGPSTGSINLSAYGYAPGVLDKYLGVKCASRAGVDMSLFTKFDCERNLTRFMPKRGGMAYRAGDEIEGITIVNEVCSYPVMEASAAEGPYNPYFINTQYQGTGLIWTGPPIPVNTSSTGSIIYELTIGPFNIQAYLNNFSIEVNPPTGGRCSYSFQYSIASCGGDVPIVTLDELTNFTFIACDEISVNYSATGLAQLSFSVYSSSSILSDSYTDITIGGVRFQGYITSYNVTSIPGTSVYNHQLQMSAIGS
jgi:hypothetical protein